MYAVAVPKAEIERTAGLLAESGLTPAAAYAKSTALAYVADADDALIIHFQDGVAAIIPVRGGEPGAVHQVACAQDKDHPQAAYHDLVRAVELVDGFDPGYALPDGIGDQDPLENSDALELEEAGQALDAVVLTGDILSAGIDPRLLADVLHRPVATLQTSVKHPDEFPPAQYASNIGMFLADGAGIGPWKSAHRSPQTRQTRRNLPPGLNVLPKRHMPPPLPVIPALIFLGLLLAVAGIVPAWGTANAAVIRANALETQLDVQQGQAKQRRSMVDRQLELDGQLQAASDEASALDSRLIETQHRMRTLLARLKAATDDSQSYGVFLYSLNPEQDGFAISGTAETHDNVLLYARAVRDSGHFGDVRVTALEGLGKEAGGMITFRILATEHNQARDIEGISSSIPAR